MDRSDVPPHFRTETAAYPLALVERPEVPGPAVNQAELNAKGLFVLQGLDGELAGQLVERSQEPQVREYCANDAAGRFGSLEKVRTWQAKGRLAVPLVQVGAAGTRSLAGFGWMGPGRPGGTQPDLPGATTTFAMRIYEAALGQGNALLYTRAILGTHMARYGAAGGVWLEAWDDNLPALRTYERAGFTFVARAPSIRDGLVVDRVYMRLG